MATSFDRLPALAYNALHRVEVRPMRIKESMKQEVVTIGPEASLQEAAARMVERRVGTLPVVDAQQRLIGIVSITDILHIFLPDVLPMLHDVDFVKDFGALESPSLREVEQAKARRVREIMSEPVAVEEECELVRALALMEKHDLRDLPVVRQGVLVGIASRVDIGRRFLEVLLAPQTRP